MKMAFESRYVSANLKRRASYTCNTTNKQKIKIYIFSLSRLCSSEEVHPMLNNSLSDIQRVTYNTADIENNNSNDNIKNGKNPLHKEESAVQYSSNAKGMLAQVRY